MIDLVVLLLPSPTMVTSIMPWLSTHTIQVMFVTLGVHFVTFLANVADHLWSTYYDSEPGLISGEMNETLFALSLGSFLLGLVTVFACDTQTPTRDREHREFKILVIDIIGKGLIVS